MSEYGPRATITKIGVCELLPNGEWYLKGWTFDHRGDSRVLDRGCLFVHNEGDTEHIGFLGWLYTDLKALSDAQIGLSMLETQDRPF